MTRRRAAARPLSHRSRCAGRRSAGGVLERARDRSDGMISRRATGARLGSFDGSYPSMERSNEATRPTPVLSAHATRYASAKSSRSVSYTSMARNRRGWSTTTIEVSVSNDRIVSENLGARRLVERLQYAHGLGYDDIGEEQLGLGPQIGSCSGCQLRRIPREMPDEVERVDERAHRRPAARAARVRRITSSQATLRFAAGTRTVPPRAR